MPNAPRNTKAILFDLDGVLVDMREAHYEALNLALSAFGARIEENEHQQIFNGLPSRQKLAILAEAGRISVVDIETINEMKQEFTRQLVPRICVPSQEKIQLLLKLQSAGFKLGCCTNSIQDMAHLMLSTAELMGFMEIVIGNDSVARPKPDPEMYHTAMEYLGVTAEETVIVEDSPHGIKAGRASKATVYEVAGVKDVTIELFSDLL